MRRYNLINKMIGGMAALAAVGALMAALAPSAEAAFALRLSSGGTTVTVDDNSLLDLSSTTGVILSSTSLGAFTLNISTGTSDPAAPPPYPHMDLSTVQINSISGGTITIALSQDGFTSTSSVLSFLTSWGFTTSGTSSLQIYVDPTNTLFSTGGTQVANFSGSSPGGFFTGGSGQVPVSGAYSVSIFWTITHTAAGLTTGNANFQVQVPEPGTLGMFGLGLLGLGFLWRRRYAHHNLAA